MPQLILTVGAPGSGKSTWAQAQRSANPSIMVIERDRVRLDQFGSRQNFDHEGAVTWICEDRAKEALSGGYTVIIADTNLNGKYRKKWKAIAAEHCVDFVTVNFHVPLEELVRRNAARPAEEQVPDHVLQQFYYRMKSHVGQ